MRDLEGNVVLLTGGTEGIGKAAARNFAERGATLVLVGRSAEKTERVVAELRALSPQTRIEYLLGDFSRLADVRAIAEKFRERHQRLDVLVNNAGAVFAGFETSADGFERTFAVNHLAHFQLTVALLDLIEKTPGARVVSTSSGAHYIGKIQIPEIASPPNKKGGFSAYSDSKLANILFTRELARRLEGTGAVANCFHPGFIRSGFAMNNGRGVQLLTRGLSSVFGKSPEHGADTLIWLATSPEAARFNGQYFYKRKPSRVNAQGKDDALAKALWSFSEELLAKERLSTAA